MTDQLHLALEGLVLVLVLAFGYRWIYAIERRIDERLQQLAESQIKEEAAIQRLATDIEDLREGLPQEYVRREDWIRFSAVLETKIDRLGERLWQVTQAMRMRDGN